MERRTVRRRRGRGVVALAALALALPTALEAQTGSIRGEVVDVITQRPIGGAQVEIVDSRQGGLTNTSGQFLILNVPVGDHEVRIQFIGFATISQTVSVSSGETAVANFQLAQAALQLDQIVVTGTARETEARSVGNTVSTIDAARDRGDRADRHGAATADRSHPRVDPDRQLRPGRVQPPRCASAGPDSLAAGLEPVVYVDGVRMKSGTQGGLDVGWGGAQGTDALDFLNPNDIESIETIKGPAASTLYGADGGRRSHPDHHQEGPCRIRIGVELLPLRPATTSGRSTPRRTTGGALPPTSPTRASIRGVRASRRTRCSWTTRSSVTPLPFGRMKADPTTTPTSAPSTFRPGAAAKPSTITSRSKRAAKRASTTTTSATGPRDARTSALRPPRGSRPR